MSTPTSVASLADQLVTGADFGGKDRSQFHLFMTVSSLAFAASPSPRADEGINIPARTTAATFPTQIHIRWFLSLFNYHVKLLHAIQSVRKKHELFLTSLKPSTNKGMLND